ncbi:SusC/RagA family TonB-linked outer membrane protein [Hymenobacter saemangeumensis]|uniref:SusC/RagA family TonB-linked outer membrane protein n=1 Tax=Hymenobacter saemangeumensis TaxID=1084522 RepID=A0ABP8HXD9_9BACT
MKNFLFIVLLLVGGLLQQAQAQSRTLTGKVTDQGTGQGLPGVTVIVKGTTIGTSSNSDGSFSLSGVPTEAKTLVFSYVGYASQERAIGSDSNFDLALAVDNKQLSEVVVTALGVERTRNSLPYSATNVEGSDVVKARNPNFINGLSGKVAGLQVRQSNTLGGSSNVVIRGTKSIGRSNQALFVVDGVPISNENTNTSDQRTGRGGYDYGNAAADINPDDIATTTVLKGAAATALYGSRAANGVIMITTKKGRQGLGVTVNTGATVGRIDKSTFIKHQTQYGGGYGRYYEDPSGFFLYRDVNGDGVDDLVVPTSEDASYGAPFDANKMVYQWDAFDAGNPNFGKARPWVAAENGADTFFQTALTTNNNVTIDGGTDRGYFKLGYTNIYDRGVLENSSISKNIINFAGSFNLTSKLSSSASVNFSKIDGKGRYGTGYSSTNQMTNFRQWWQTNVDMKEQRAAYFRNKQNNTWNYTDPDDLTPIYWNNPYWTRYENYEEDQRHRTFGNVSTTYKVADWLDIMGRVTMDSYDERQDERQAVGSTTNDGPDFYQRFNSTFREYNFDLFANINKQVTEDFSIRGVIGANMRRNFISNVRARTSGGLIIPGLYSLSNSKQLLSPPSERETRVGVDGIFANANLGFKEMIFLDLTARQDKSTTLPKENNTFFYPSAALGFVFSQLLQDTPWLSYGKIRGNYAEVGNDAPELSVYDIYNNQVDGQGNAITTFGGAPLFSVPSSRNNRALKPERTKSFEAGIEASFLKSRVGFDLTLYEQRSVDQIFSVDVSRATGYNGRFINAGEVRNRGIELTAFVTPVRTDNLNWTINANFTRNRNQVVSLFGDLDNILLANYQGGVTSNATVGQAYGTLRGADYVYDANGNKQITLVKNAAGLPTAAYYRQTASANNVIADPNPNWTGGLANTVGYKGVSLYFLLDVRSGGQVFSLDRFYGLATGMTDETTQNNELGNPSRSPIVRNADGSYAPSTGGVILSGTYAPGTTINGVDVSGQTNAIRTSNTNYGLYGYARNPAAGFVYDASYVKLREVSLSYALPKSLVDKVGAFKGVELSLIGRNLWILHKNLPDADPEEALSSGNLGQGYSSGAYPAVRTVGANLRLSF